MERVVGINKIKKVAICGIGYQTETFLKYLKEGDAVDCIVITTRFTQKPEECYKIPSIRNGKRNSFSEVDMLMDAYVESVPVKRFDMLDEIEKEEYTFVFYSSEESLELFNIIRHQISDNYYVINDVELKKINEYIWGNHLLINELWKSNAYMYSEIQMLKNCMRRQMQSTAFDFHFEFHIVEHCNLQCAGCTHFSPLAEEEFLNIKEFEKDIKRLSKLTGGNTRFINLLGGEPLLHPDICKFIELSREAFPKTIIRVVTNGIMLKEMKDSFYECCRNNSIIVGITEYPINVDYNKTIGKLISEGIEYESFNGAGLPRDEMWRLSLDPAGNSRPLDNFIQCPRANACIFVSHGKVFNCATMANIGHMNNAFGTNFELSKDDYVDIYEIDDANEMFEKLCNPKPFCRYCNIEKRNYGVTWQRSLKDVSEWT